MVADLTALDDLITDDDLDLSTTLTGLTVLPDVELVIELRLSEGRISHAVRIRCHRPVSWRIVAGDVLGAHVDADHPAAVLYRERWVEVYVRGVPDDVERLVRDLQVLHDDRVGEYLRFADAVNSGCRPRELLRIGYGILGAGPVSVMTEWVRLLEAHGLTTALLPGRAAADHLLGMELGCGYVVAERFDLVQA